MCCGRSRGRACRTFLHVAGGSGGRLLPHPALRERFLVSRGSAFPARPQVTLCVRESGAGGPTALPHQCAKAPDRSGQLCSGRCPGRPGVCPGDRLACLAQGQQQLLGHVLHGHRGPGGICDAGRQLEAQLTPRPLGMPAHAWRSVARGSVWFCHSRCSAELTAGGWECVRGPPSSSSRL